MVQIWIFFYKIYIFNKLYLRNYVHFYGCRYQLRYMEKILLVIQNIAAQSRTPADVSEWVETVRSNFGEVLAAIDKGEI